MTQDTDREKLEHSLMALFSKCTSFGFSFGHTTTKEEFAEMLSKGESLDHQEAAYEAMKLVDAYLASQRKAAERAYGGCHNCYGKGYATVDDSWMGVDTDTDIGSPGGIVRGGNTNAMKFCDCDRGQQLEKRMIAAEIEGQIKILNKIASYYSDNLSEKHVKLYDDKNGETVYIDEQLAKLQAQKEAMK